MRADLHVHSRHSGPTDLPVLRHLGQECYSEPKEVYEQARRRGMDLVTLTDHDSIEGALEIAHLPGAFGSEEVTLVLPGGRKLHLGVYDITQAQHQRIARLRFDPEALLAYAHDKEEFLDGLRRGLTVPCGRSGTDPRLTAEVFRILAAAHREAFRSAARGDEDPLRLLALLSLSSFLPLIPLVTAAVYAHERRFGALWFGRLAAHAPSGPNRGPHGFMGRPALRPLA